MLAMLYYPRRTSSRPRFRWISPGGVAGAGRVARRVGRLRVLRRPTSAPTTRPTAALAGVILFLVWLWIANLALLLGAEFNAELERSREIEAGEPGAEHEIQLEPRDERSRGPGS